MSLTTEVKRTVKHCRMLEPGDSVLAGVSGGPDSVALLCVLVCLKKTFSLNLFIAHLNHNLRGKESDKDALFVGELGRRFNLPVICGRVEGPAIVRKKGVSAEEALREARYGFLKQTAREVKAKKIALGHTRDDQAETVLMRLVRGAGIAGMRGIPAVRKMEEAVIIRPLINCWRKDVLDYLDRRKMRWRFDSSNRDKRYFRNRVRLELMPYLEKKYNPGIKQVLASLSENCAADYEYLSDRGRKAEGGVIIRSSRNKISFRRDKFLSRDTALRKEIFRRAIRMLKGNLRGLTFRHWKDADQLLRTAKGKKILDLPGEIRIEVEAKGFSLARERPAGKETEFSPVRESFLLKVPGITRIAEPTLTVAARISSRAGERRCPSPSRPKRAESFDLERIKLPLVLRFRQPGDRIKPLGMRNFKKLKNLMIDEKIPVTKRDRIPLIVAADGEILWTVGVRMSEAAKITGKTRKVLNISVSVGPRKRAKNRHK